MSWLSLPLEGEAILRTRVSVLGIVGCSFVVAMALPVMAEAPHSHVCPPGDEPAQAVMPPMPALELPLPGSPPAAPAARPKELAPEPAQVLGCLERDYPLQPIDIDEADKSVAIAEEPGSLAATYRFRSAARRDARIAAWAQRWSPNFEPSKPSTLFINGWKHASWRLPDGSTVNAMYPELQTSGRLCIVRADSRALRDALPVLNNWCMDTLDLWRKD